MKTFKLSMRSRDHGKVRFQVLDGSDIVGSVTVDDADADALLRSWKGEVDGNCYRGMVTPRESSQSKMTASLLAAFRRGQTKAFAE